MSLRPLRIRVVGFLAAGAAVGLFGSGPAAAVEGHMSGAGRDIRETVIADGIYQFQTIRDSYVRYLNSVVVVNDADVLVFDTNTRPSSARLVLAEIRKITDKPVRYVVNSHHHPDHWSGNQVYLDAFPGAEIIASEETRRFMENVAPAWPARFAAELAKSQAELEKEIASGKQADGTALTPEQRRDDEDDVRDYRTFAEESAALRRVYPTLTYVDHLTLTHGGREFRFLSVTGDAEGTTVLWLPKEKVLMTGDAVSYPMPYVNLPGRHAKSLRRLAELDFDVLIPGHGPAFRDRTYLNLEIVLLDTVRKGVHDALQKGMTTFDEVQKAVTAGTLREAFTRGDPDLERRYPERVRALVRLAIREERDGQDYP